MDGVVISWDVRRRLVEKRPISRMQYVLEIADLEGAWQLELLMPEKKMGYIMERRKRQPDVPLRVEFVLATKPAQKFYGMVTEIHDRAEVRSSSDNARAAAVNTVSIKVSIDDLESLRSDLYPGAECSARIDCGKRPLGYVLFYEVIVYVQKNILFRWF
jgi:signal transduction histidine kinase